MAEMLRISIIKGPLYQKLSNIATTNPIIQRCELAWCLLPRAFAARPKDYLGTNTYGKGKIYRLEEQGVNLGKIYAPWLVGIWSIVSITYEGQRGCKAR